MEASQNFKYDFFNNKEAKKLKKTTSTPTESTDFIFEAYKKTSIS
jgi:hypothetical protein